jgi:MYXO-CTERM domain-containing protein
VEDFDFSSSEIIAEIAIDGDAEVGVRDVSVTTGWGTGTKQDGFGVVGGGGGICSCSSSKAPGVRSEMMPTLAAVGLVLGAGYWFVRRSKRNRQE